jgi:hypothetical protein
MAAALMYGLRMLTASAIANRYLHAPLRLHEALLVPAKDLFLSAMWALAFLGDTVHWSGNEFRVLKNGEMELVSSDAAPAPTYTTAIPAKPDPHAAALRAPSTSGTGPSLHA